MPVATDTGLRYPGPPTDDGGGWRQMVRAGRLIIDRSAVTNAWYDARDIT